MGFLDVFKKALGITIGFALTIGTGGIGGIGFIAAIKAITLRQALTFFGANLVLGFIASALTPELRRPQGRVPVFTGATRAPRLVGRKEMTGVITDINEFDDDWLKVTYTVVSHPCEILMGLRIMGRYSEFTEDVSGLSKTSEYKSLVRNDYSDRIRVFWNLTGEYDQSINQAMGIERQGEDTDGNTVTIGEDKLGEGQAWVGVWIKRDDWFSEQGFSLDAIKFKVARTKDAFDEAGENPVDAIIRHMSEYCGIDEKYIDKASADKARKVCDTYAGGERIRLNGHWIAGTEYETLMHMVDAMDGALMQIGDKYHIFANPLSTDPPATVIIDESQVIDEVAVSPLPSWDNKFNRCEATYSNDTDGEVVSTPIYSFPSLIESDGAEYTYDGRHFQFLERPNEIKRVLAQRTYRFRYATQAHVTVLEGEVDVEVWDKVRLNIPSAGLADDGDEYRIMNITAGLDGKLNLLCQKEFAEGWYPALHASGDVFSPDIDEREPEVRYVDPPGDVMNFRIISRTETSITLAWNPVAGATRYQIAVLSNGKELLKRYWEHPDVTSFEFGAAGPPPNVTLLPGEEYEFRIWAANPVLSNNYASVTGRTLGATTPITTAPTGLRVVRMTKTSYGIDVLVAWNPVDKAREYRVQMRESTQSFPSTSEERGSTFGTTFLASGRKARTRYKFRVKARNNHNNPGEFGPWSNVFEFTTIGEAALPGIPTISTITIDRYGTFRGNRNAYVHLTWRSGGNTDHYRMRIRRGLNGPWELRRVTYPQLKTQLPVPLRAGDTYYFQIRGHNSRGTSAWSATRSITV